jgi:mRNA interferase RelE/StbE
MSNKKFDVRLDPDAVKEYNRIDGSVLNIVNKAIDELQYRADEIGKILINNTNTKLYTDVL